MNSIDGQILQNRYLLQRQLGAGAMGAVYLTRDRLTGEEVALKRVLNTQPVRQSLSTVMKISITNEFEVLASLRHPHIVNVMDYGIDSEGLPYFTMRYLPNATNLRQASAGKTVQQKTRLLIQVLDALTYLKQRGIIHRDLKPDNILVTQDSATGEEMVNVLDFGLALTQPRAQESGVSGTIAYIAPEVIDGGSPSHSADLYAVGVIAYEMFTERPMYNVTSIRALIYAILNDPPDMSPVIEMLTQLETSSNAESETAQLADQKTEANSIVGEDTIILDRGPSDVTRYTLRNTPALDTQSLDAQSLHRQSTSSNLAVEKNPATLVDILYRLTAKDSAERYTDPQRVIADISRVTGESPAQSTASRESFLQAAKFVGRQHEVKLLSEALESALTRRGSLWLIGGESGVGKSRLVNELRHLGLVRGALVLMGEAVNEAAQPYQIWSAVVSRLLLQTPVSDDNAAALKLLVPDIERLLSRSVGEPLDNASVTNAIISLFNAHSEPILLILEDLQWASAESLDVLLQLQGMAQSRSLLIVADYRNDERPSLPEQFPHAERLHLQRLDRNALRELTVSMIGEAGNLPALVKLLQQETEGNVFFLIETVRALAEAAGRLDAIGSLELPTQVFTNGIEEIIRRRLERVSAAYQPLLRVAAVAGRNLDVRLLRALSGGIDFEDWLTTANHAAVVEFRNERWHFTHDKLREHVIAHVSDEQRREVNRQVAETLENLYPPEQNANALMNHWRHAGDKDKEFTYIRIVGRRAAQLGLYDDALVIYQRGLELADTPGLEIEAHNWLGGVYEFLSQYDKGTLHLNTALQMAHEHDYPRFETEILDKLAWLDIRRGEVEQAQLKAEQMLRTAASVDDETRLHALNLLGIVHHIKGEMQQSYDWLMQGMPIAERIEEPYVLANHLNSLGAAEEGLGRAEDAIRTLTRASELAKSIGNPALLGNIEGNLGRLLYNQRNMSEAHTHFMTALIAFQRVRNTYGEALAAYYLAFIALYQTDIPQARTYLRLSLEKTLEIGAAAALLTAACGIAECYRQMGDEQRAAELITVIRAHPLSAGDADIMRESEQVMHKLPAALVDETRIHPPAADIEALARHALSWL